MTEPFMLRLATVNDIPALEVLIPRSVRGLQAGDYSAAQMEAALGPVFGVDRQLIRDGTYFVVETQAAKAGRIIVGCGGWSRRKAVFGGDRERAGEDEVLNPSCDPARIRAFFVDPDFARRGIGRAILQACEEALCAAGFREAVMVATLTGERLYATLGYAVQERYEVVMAGGLELATVRMGKRFG